MAKIELLPCPFCGSKKLMFGYAFKPGHNDSRKIECAECESHGPIRDGKQAAADAWNERVREWKMSDKLKKAIDEMFEGESEKSGQ